METKNLKQPCCHDRICLESDPKHFRQFSHPQLEKLLQPMNNTGGKITEDCDCISDFKSLVKSQLEMIRYLKSKNKIVESDRKENVEDNVVVMTPEDIKELKNSAEGDSQNRFENSTENIKTTTKESLPEDISDEDSGEDDDWLEDIEIISASRKVYHRHYFNMEKLAYTNKDTVEKIASEMEDSVSQIKKSSTVFLLSEPRENKMNIKEKLEKAAPLNLFYFCMALEPKFTYSHNIFSFRELLSIGPLTKALIIAPKTVSSTIAHIMKVYADCELSSRKPLTLIAEMTEEDEADFPRWITPIRQQENHNTSLMIFSYEDTSVRIIVGNGLIVPSEFLSTCSMIWISPRLFPCKGVPEYPGGDSSTHFKRDLLRYLAAYEAKELESWIDFLRNYDFHPINVIFVASVPGEYKIDSNYSNGAEWGQVALAKHLNDHIGFGDDFSKTGQLIIKPKVIDHSDHFESFLSQFQKTLSGIQHMKIGNRKGANKPIEDYKIIYPSLNNLLEFRYKMYDSHKLTKRIFDKTNIREHLCEWKSENKHMTNVSPNFNCYCSVSLDNTKLYYFLLTSHPLTSDAWGLIEEGKLKIKNYEAGVIFLPKLFINEDTFICDNGQAEGDLPVFSLPFDLPLTPYNHDTIPKFETHLDNSPEGLPHIMLIARESYERQETKYYQDA